MMNNFAGKDGFIWFKGVVEDRNDPLKLGRARVRCFGFHTEDKTELPTEYLPWAIPMVPLDHAQHNVGVREADWVVGFFRDGLTAQEPVMMGVIPGIPENKANPDLGFNDPTTDEQLSASLVPRPPEMAPPPEIIDSESGDVAANKDAEVLPYIGTTVGVFADKFDIKTFPFDVNKDGVYNDEDARLISFDANRDGVIDKKEDEFQGTDFFGTLPMSRYPLENDLKTPTTNPYERGIDETGTEPPIVSKKKSDLMEADAAAHVSSGVASDAAADGESFGEIPSAYAAKYPYNHAELSESGHLLEVDDTPDKQRLHRYHRTGTFDEIHPDGNWVFKSVRNIYKFAKENFFWACEKSANITAAKILRLLSGEVMNLTSGKDMNLTVEGGNLNIYVRDGDTNIKIVGTANIVTEDKAKLHCKDDLYLIIDGSVFAKVKGDWLQDVDGNIRIKAGQNVDIDGIITSVRGSAMVVTDTPITSIANGIGDIKATTAEAVGPAEPYIPSIPIVLDNAPDIKEDPSAEGTSELQPGYILDQPKQGDLWKPTSDSDGNAVTLSDSPVVPQIYEAIPTGELETVTIQWLNADFSITSWTVTRPKHVKGRLIETARSVGLFEGTSRNIFRWKKPGGSYGGGAILKTGMAEWLLIDAAARHD